MASSRAATVSDVPHTPLSPRLQGNQKHEEAVQLLERNPFGYTTLYTKPQSRAVAELAQTLTLEASVASPAALGDSIAEAASLPSSNSSFLSGAASTIVGSFTSPKEAEELLEARRLAQEEKNKERATKQRKEKESVLRSRVCLVGASGVGKTTLKSCICQTDFLKTLPDVAPSTSSGSSQFYYHSSKGDKLEVNFIDSGPLDPATGNLHHLFASDSVMLLLVNLSYVKQRTNRKGGAAAANLDPVFLHPKDQQVIFGYLHTMAAASPGTTIFLVGTHSDLLSDNSPQGIEQVLRYLSDIMRKEIRTIHESLGDSDCLRFVTSFGVSCQTRRCVAENRQGGPTSINQMWEFMCELMMKDARLAERRGKPFGAGVMFSPEYSLVQQLLHRMKSELYLVLVDYHTFDRALYTLGLVRRYQRVAVMQCLQDAGDIVVLPGQQGNPHRPKSILLFPHLLCGCASIAILQNLWASYPIAARGKLLPGLDIAACDTADASRRLGEGYPSPRLLVELSRCLTLVRRNPDERAELYVALLQQSDFLFSHGAKTPDEEGDYIDADSEEFLEGRVAAPTYIIPCMLPKLFPSTALKAAHKAIQKSNAIAIGRRIVFAVPIPGLFHGLQCRLGHLLVNGRTIARDGSWLRLQPLPGGQGDARILLLHRQCKTEREDNFIEYICVAGPNTPDPVHTVLNGAAIVHETVIDLMKSKFSGGSLTVFPSRPDIFYFSIMEEMERLEALHREPTVEEWSVVHQGGGMVPYDPAALDESFTN